MPEFALAISIPDNDPAVDPRQVFMPANAAANPTAPKVLTTAGLSNSDSISVKAAQDWLSETSLLLASELCK